MAENRAHSTPIGEEAENAVEEIKRGVSTQELIDGQRGKWLERHRGAVIQLPKQFGHPSINKLYERNYEKMSQNLFFISVYGRAILSENGAKDVHLSENSVRKTIENAIKAVDSMITDAKALKEGNNIPDSTLLRPYQFTVTFASPLDKLLFDLLEKADQFLTLNAALWIEGMLGANQDDNEKMRTNNEFRVKKAINDTLHGITTNHRRVLNAINRMQEKMKEAPVSAKASEASRENGSSTAEAANAASASATPENEPIATPKALKKATSRKVAVTAEAATAA